MSSRLRNPFAAAWPNIANTINSLESLPTRKKETKGFGRNEPGSSKWQLCGRCCSFAILGTPFVKRSVLRRSVAVPESDGTLGVPERYSSEDWSEHIRNFPFSVILKRIRSHLAFNALFALCIHVFNFFTGLVRPPPLALLSACSTALGLLLVFRTTAAYERWCAGYRCVRETKQHLQQLRRLARLWMSEEDLEWMDGQLATFPAYLGTFLGGGVGARGKSWALLGEMERDPRDILVTCGEGIYKCLRPDSPTSALYVEAGALWRNFICSPCKIMQHIHLISPFSPKKRPFCQWFLVAELVAFGRPEKLTLAHQDRMQGHITGALSSIEEMAQIVTVPVTHWARQYAAAMPRAAQWRFEKRDVEKQWHTSWLINFWDYHYAVLFCVYFIY